MNGTPQFDPLIAVLGSLMFCAAPLFFAAYAANRRIGGRTDQIGLVLGATLVSIILFVAFLLTLGPNGIYAAIASAAGWLLGFWQAARRNEAHRFYRTRGVSRQQTPHATRQDSGASGKNPSL